MAIFIKLVCTWTLGHFPNYVVCMRCVKTGIINYPQSTSTCGTDYLQNTVVVKFVVASIDQHSAPSNTERVKYL